MTLYLYPNFTLFFFTGKTKSVCSCAAMALKLSCLKRLGLFRVRSNSAFTRCMVSKVG